MKGYLVKRLLLMTIVAFVVLTITFVLTHIAPGDPALQWVGLRPTAEQLQRARTELGLDKPFYQRYAIYLSNVLTGHFGVSIRSKQPVMKEIISFFPATVELVSVAILISLVFGIFLGVLSAIRRESTVDHVGRIVSLSGVAVPIFWLGMMLQLFFYTKAGILPIQGRISSEVLMDHPFVHWTGLYFIDTVISGNLVALGSALIHMILPALTLGFTSVALISRMARSSMIEVLREDYVRTARAYGFKERLIRYKYALKNAMIPTITAAGIAYGFNLGGSVLVESIFDWPGIGRYMAIAIRENDYPAVLGATMIYCLMYVTLNLIIDLIYLALDPRVQYLEK